MYEITYEENTCLNHIPESVGSHYDFTFENRYDISHRPKKNRIEYTAYDRTTGLVHVIAEFNAQVDASQYPRMILEILKHAGDPRYKGADAYPPDDLIDVIFRAVMPAYGYAVREQQVEMAKSIYLGLSAKKATLCEAEVGTGKTMAYLVAGFAAKLFDKSYSFMGCPVTITTSSIELQKSIMEKEIPALSKMLMEFGLISKPLTAVLRKGKEHYFCPNRYHEYIDSLHLHPQLYSKTIQELLSAELLDKALDLDGLPLSPHIKSRICVKGSCRNCPRMGCCKYASFLDHASAPYRFDFQVTNHNLFLTAQKMRKNSASKGRLLPCNFCIVDEAHKLAETAVDVFGAEIAFDEICEYLYSVKYNGGSVPKKRMKYKMLLAKANRLNKKLLSMFAHYKFKADEDICEVKIEMTPAMHDTIKKLISALKQIDKWSVLEGSAGGNTAISLTERLSVFLVRKNNMFWMIKRDTFIIAMNLITEHNAQLRRMMDLANTIGSNLLLISTESFFHDAISLVFKESFRDTDKLLDWWLYESYDQELYLGEQKFDASDPGNFYDFLVKYRQDWKEQRQCNAPPQKPVQISKDCFRKVIALVRKEQHSLRTVEDAARECSSIFNVHCNTSKYLDALILLLQDQFGDAKGLIRWYITKQVDHKVFIGDTMYDLNDPGTLYDFMITQTTELKCMPSFL